MGVPKLKGYINKDENLWFIAHISTTEDFEDDFGCSGELYDNYVKNRKIRFEIEKEEKKNPRVVFTITLLFSYKNKTKVGYL